MSANYLNDIRQWRLSKEDELHGDTGWLALAGLYWLKQGANTLGTDPASDVVLPDGSAPAHVGEIELRAGQATLRLLPGVAALADGRSVTTVTMRSDERSAPSVVWIGRLRFIVIRRDIRFAVRLWDHRVDTRAHFAGRQWYAIDTAYRVVGSLTPFEPPRTLQIASMVGGVDEMESPGAVRFALNGQDLSLTVVRSGDGLRIYFRDQTSGDTTYPACRFLIPELGLNGECVLDFNRAYSPPCAFTAFATCPLPPPENILPVRIEAGELYPDWQHH